VILELLLVVGAYVLGSIPCSLFAVRMATGGDVRKVGSGNPGATNALRAAGWKVGAVVVLCDAAKGAIPIFMMLQLNPASRWLAAVALAAVIGHCYPVWLRFRGGKGVATSIGAFLVIAPKALAVTLAVIAVVMVIRRVMSLASVVGAAVFPLVLWWLVGPHPHLMAGVVIMCTLIVLRHTPNLRRLARGEEPRVDFGDRDRRS